MRIALIDKCPSSTNYSKYLDDLKFEHFHLCSIRQTKILKKDVDIEIDTDDYDFIILIGSEAAKHFAKVGSVTDMAGQLVDGKYIPLINPAMLAFKPEAEDGFRRSIQLLHKHLRGEKVVDVDGDFRGITDEAEAMEYLLYCLNHPEDTVALDTETTSLYPRDGYVLGMSISAALREGAYILSDVLTQDHLDIVQRIIDSKEIVFHNAKFDMKMMGYHFNLRFKHRIDHIHDTLLQHYNLDETQGTHGLKQLALKFTSYGDYDKALDEFKKDYCAANKIKQEDFNYSMIPFEIMYKYASIDTAATLEIHRKFWPLIEKNDKLRSVYRKLLVPGMFALLEIEENGIPFDMHRLKFAQARLYRNIQTAFKDLYATPEVTALEQAQEKQFNPNSVKQLRSLLFDYLQLPPTGKLTGTGADSTDAKVLEELSPLHPIVGKILEIRKQSKILGTYVDKLIAQLDRDGRLRTFFNLTSTTSGRLSSSGKFNAQQIPRDDPIVKGTIVARPGYKIISQDLSTAKSLGPYYSDIVKQSTLIAGNSLAKDNQQPSPNGKVQRLVYGRRA